MHTNAEMQLFQTQSIKLLPLLCSFYVTVLLTVNTARHCFKQSKVLINCEYFPDVFLGFHFYYVRCGTQTKAIYCNAHNGLDSRIP